MSSHSYETAPVLFLTRPARRVTRVLLTAASVGCLSWMAGLRTALDTMTLPVTHPCMTITIVCIGSPVDNNACV